MTASKTFNKHPKHKALYNALMESILADEDAIDKGVADIQKKREPNDADRDKDPPTGPDQGKSAQEETVFEAGDNQVPHNLGEDMGNTDEPPVVKADPKDWFNKPERPHTPDLEWNEDWNNPEGDRYPFDLSKPLPLVKSGNRQIVLVDYFFNDDLAYLQGGSTDRTYMTSLTKTKAAKYDLPGIENMKLNISKPRTRKKDLSQRAPYTALSDPQGVIYEDKLNIKRLIRSDELYKFSDSTLQLVRDTLHDMATNLRMGYNKAMPKRKWSHLDKTQSYIMVKEIDRQLRERRLMRSLEKFIFGRHYGEDLRLL
ncbi:hypothetical protein Tco_1260983 [Tanacetum coccineum]